MPTYDYKCTACGHTFEQFQSIMADPIKRCPQCGKAKVKRLIGTGAGLIFKGSGFYITDYRDAGYKEKAKAESGGDAKGEGKGETKPETKAGGDAGAAAAPSTGAEAKPAAAPKPESKGSSKNDGKSPRKKQ
jgi:putative FmdB family regulatory protein